MSNNYAFINCNLIDGNLNSNAKNDMIMLIENTNNNGVNKGSISKIGRKNEVKIPDNFTIIDINHKYIMPGLINAHVHLFSNGSPWKANNTDKSRISIIEKLKNRRKKNSALLSKRDNVLNALNSGVTTVRCLGDQQYDDITLRNEIDNNKYLGPRLIGSGAAICVTGGHGASIISIISDSPWEGRKCVRQNVTLGVDFIKICITGGIVDARKVGDAGRLEMTLEEVTAVCEEAHKIGLMVAAHVESTEGVRIALLGGVDTIEHGSEMDEEMIELFKNNPKTLRGYSSLISTLYAVIPMHSLDTALTNVSEISRKNASIVYNKMLRGVKQAINAGVKVGIGTDASLPYVTHYNTWRELDYLVKCADITHKQAIYLATKSNAEILGIDNETGSLTVGKSADFIVLDENPLENLRTLSNPNMVVCRGNIINNPKINKIENVDEILDQIAL
ncbi:MAG: amidohydrolase family protein [Bacillota bacterium]|nr:amidohydrolase family protein [Bacillota bacterium]